MAIYFDLMALDQRERERKQQALMEAGRIGLKAYLGIKEQNMNDALANLKMGQDANNTALIRSALENRGATFPEGSVGSDIPEQQVQEPIRPSLAQQMMSVSAQPRVAQEPRMMQETPQMQPNARVVSETLPPMNRPNALPENVIPTMNQPVVEQSAPPDLYTAAVQREQSLPYWQKASPKQREAALSVISKRFQQNVPMQSEPIPPKLAASKTGLPVKEVLTVRNLMSRSGIRGVNGSEYRNNFEDTAAVVFDPNVPYQDKLTKIGSYLETDREIRGFYGDNAASDHMLKLLMGGLGGKGGAGKQSSWQITDQNRNPIGDTLDASTGEEAVKRFKRENPNYKGKVVLANKIGATTGEPEEPMKVQKLITDFNEASPSDQLAYLKANANTYAKMGLSVKKQSGGLFSGVTSEINRVLGRQERLVLTPEFQEEEKKKTFSGLWR